MRCCSAGPGGQPGRRAAPCLRPTPDPTRDRFLPPTLLGSRITDKAGSTIAHWIGKGAGLGLALAALGLAAGCGQKGPLRLPEPPPAAKPAPQAAPPAAAASTPHAAPVAPAPASPQ